MGDMLLTLFCLTMGPFVLYQGIKGLKTGSVMEGGQGNGDKTVEHNQSPINFWFTCIFYIGLGGALLYMGFSG